MRLGLTIRACTAALLIALPLRAVADLEDGASGLWQALLRLQTTAGALHVCAHPDDEDAGMLALLSRGRGVRTALLTLTRGEGGANLVGSELFDGLGVLRTEEMTRAARVYGVGQFYTRAVDYGYSKTQEESLEKWGREAVLRDMTYVVRTFRPDVIISRFQGSPRDGHGNHQLSGTLAREVFSAAGDPTRFPEQISRGLKPWKPRKLYACDGSRRSAPGGDSTARGDGDFARRGGPGLRGSASLFDNHRGPPGICRP